MTAFEYSKYDGREKFSPQSADAVFDQLSQYLMEYGDEVLRNLQDWEDEHPEIVEMLVKRGYVERDEKGEFSVTPKGMRRVENRALSELFQVREKSGVGQHELDTRGQGSTVLEESRQYQFGDSLSLLNLQETLKNAISRGETGTPVRIQPEDFEVYETEAQTSCATVVLVDMSGSMARYGKFGSAKRVAMALSAMVRTRFPQDWLQVVGFYTYATPLSERELLRAGPKPVSLFEPRVRMRINLDRPPAMIPEHFTNIHAGLQFARRMLKRHPAANKQIILVTDGEPTAHVEGRDLVLIYPPSEKTAQITLAEAKRCAAAGLKISSFALVEDYFYFGLVRFVEQMSQISGGICATCNAQDLGNMVIQSFVQGRKQQRRM